MARQVAETVKLDGQEFPIREAARGLLPDVYFLKTPKGWELLDHDGSLAIELNARGQKHPGLQGPIDDAFTGPFLVVRGTGKPLNVKVQNWADDRLTRFTGDWSRYFRGDLRIKDDVEVTDEDIEQNHLILFGDPGSNRLIARVLPALPLTWTATEVKLDGTFPAADHAPVLIQPNPLNRLRYVVINSRPHLRGEGTRRDQRPPLSPPGRLRRHQDRRIRRGQGGRLLRRAMEEALIVSLEK